MELSTFLIISVLLVLLIIAFVFYAQLNKIHLFQEQKIGSIQQELDDRLTLQRKALQEQFDFVLRELKHQDETIKSLHLTFDKNFKQHYDAIESEQKKMSDKMDEKIQKFVYDMSSDITNQIQINAQIVELLQKQYQETDQLNINLRKEIFDKTDAILTEIKSPLNLY